MCMCISDFFGVSETKRFKFSVLTDTEEY